MKNHKNYVFYTDELGYETIESKGDKKYFITGYISTKDRDLVNDVVTEEALSGMLSQIQQKNIKLDVEHEAWREENPSIVPVGKIIEAKRDEKGIFVKAEINKASNKFKEVWNSIKDGFLDAFSIAYKATNYVHKVIDGVKTRMLNGVELLNVALTGNPVNPECKMVEVFTKSLNEMEDNKMTEEIVGKKDEVVEEQPVEEVVKETPEAEAKEESVVEEAVAEEPEVDESNAEVEEKAKEITSLKKKLEDYEAEIKSLKEQLEKPIMKTTEQKSVEEVAQVKGSVNPLDAL